MERLAASASSTQGARPGAGRAVSGRIRRVRANNAEMMLKEGAIPLLIQIKTDDHYEEYEFVEKKGEKEYIFKDYEGKKISFESD